MFDFIHDLLPVIIVFGSVTLIEVTPIKFNPWSSLIKWMGNIMLGDFKIEMEVFKKDMTDFKDEMFDFKKDQEKRLANDMRWHIIDFAKSCRRGEHHSEDAWRQIISQIDEYRDYTRIKGIVNGLVDIESEYIIDCYRVAHICSNVNIRKDYNNILHDINNELYRKEDTERGES